VLVCVSVYVGRCGAMRRNEQSQGIFRGSPGMAERRDRMGVVVAGIMDTDGGEREARDGDKQATRSAFCPIYQRPTCQRSMVHSHLTAVCTSQYLRPMSISSRRACACAYLHMPKENPKLVLAPNSGWMWRKGVPPSAPPASPATSLSSVWPVAISHADVAPRRALHPLRLVGAGQRARNPGVIRKLCGFGISVGEGGGEVGERWTG
jgi:hypothetical protein